MAAPFGPARRGGARDPVSSCCLIALSFDAPLKEIANPTITSEPGESAVVFRSPTGVVGSLPPVGGRRPCPGAIVVGLMALPYMDRNPMLSAKTPTDCSQHLHDFPGHLDSPDIDWLRIPRSQLGSWVWPWEEWHGEL